MKSKINYLHFTVFAILPTLFIFPYGKYRCTHKNFKDPLEATLFWGLDGWSATHFFWYMVLGYVFPETFILSTCIGIAWELFEHYYGKNRPGWLGGYGDCQGLESDKEEDGNWWYGKWSDIVCNTSGFIIGQYIKAGKIIIL
tara:strand:+ start:68 stop:493 length:426 start_codon:yes stop_codon:yes gene_type:complete